ncbi:hypothetical protein E4T42_07668 [Aureobasidium subglaciale]|nr:hypothetical protein E4T42_07668 [Aureobasidium subglaciale]
MDPSITKGVGLLSASAIRSLKAACSFSEVEPEERVVFMSPSLPLITVHVTSGLRGHGAMDFGIHQNILEHCSPFFKALLTADSAPSLIKNEDEPVVPQSPKVNAVICLEADLAAFKLYTEWVYSGHLVSETIRIQDTKLDALGQAYLLGEKLLDCEFENAVVDAILNQIIVEGRVDLTLPNLIFDKTCHTSPLRKLLVDLHVWYGHKDWLKRILLRHPSQPLSLRIFQPPSSTVTATTKPEEIRYQSSVPASTMSIQMDFFVRKIESHVISDSC